MLHRLYLLLPPRLPRLREFLCTRSPARRGGHANAAQRWASRACEGRAGVEARGDIRVTADNTEATIAVGVSHKRGGGWVDLPLPPEERGPDSLYIFHV